MRNASLPIMALMRVVAKPGTSRTTTLLAHPLADRARRREVSSEVSSPRTISSSFIRCTGLKKCMPAKRAGAPVRGGHLGDRERRGVRGEERVRGRAASRPAEELELERHRLRRRLDHQVGVRRPPRRGRSSSASRACAAAAAVGRQLAERDALVEVAWIDARGALDARRRRRRKTGRRSRHERATWAMPRPIVPAPRTQSR